MRPLSPFWGRVLNDQLLTRPATISTSANGVVTTQLSFLPPASSSATEVFLSSDNRPASVLPPEPAPTITKSKVSLTAFSSPDSGAMRQHRTGNLPSAFFRRGLAPNLRFCARSGKSGSRGRFFKEKQVFYLSQNPQNRQFGPFQRGRALINTHCTRWP